MNLLFLRQQGLKPGSLSLVSIRTLRLINWYKSNLALSLGAINTQVVAKKLGTFFIAENYFIRQGLLVIRLLFLVRFWFDLQSDYCIALGIQQFCLLLLFDLSLSLSDETLEFSPLKDIPDCKARKQVRRCFRNILKEHSFVLKPEKQP